MPHVWRQSWRFISDFARSGGVATIWAGLWTGLGALAEGLGVAMLAPLIALMTAEGAGSGRLAVYARPLLEAIPGQSRLGRLAVLLGVFAALMAARGLIVLARDVTVARLQMGFVETLRMNVVSRLAASSWEAVSRLSHARVTQAIGGDVQRCGAAASFTLQGAVAAVMLSAQLILALVLSPQLAALSLATLAVAGLTFGPLLRRSHDNGRAATQAHHLLAHGAVQFLGGLKLALSHNRQGAFVEHMAGAMRSLTDQQVAFVRQQTSARLLVTTVSAGVAAAAILIGLGWLDLAPSVLITLLVVLARTGGPVMQLQQAAQQLANTLPAYEQLQALTADLRDADGAAAASAAAGGAADLEGPLLFREAGFLHPEGRGLREVSLTLAPGEVVGIAGSSGAGKTTLADLAAGLYRPLSGAVLANGVALEGAALVAWRERVAYVTQDPFLFHDTIRHNLLWADPLADEAALWRALALAEAEALVRGRPQGLDTVIGERGALVSGGERQRLALARAILQQPRMLILDEATSAIDVESERLILARLRDLCPQPTILIIAHRAESLAGCDRILTVEEGRVVSQAAGAPPAAFQVA